MIRTVQEMIEVLRNLNPDYHFKYDEDSKSIKINHQFRRLGLLDTSELQIPEGCEIIEQIWLSGYEIVTILNLINGSTYILRNDFY